MSFKFYFSGLHANVKKISKMASANQNWMPKVFLNKMMIIMNFFDKFKEEKVLYNILLVFWVLTCTFLRSGVIALV